MTMHDSGSKSKHRMRRLLPEVSRHPVSLFIVAAVIYGSLFRPPSVGIPLFPGIDKVAHFGMYTLLSGVLWTEYLLRRRQQQPAISRRAFVGAAICPILLGGVVELLQHYTTAHRSGDWLDMAANTAGVAIATLAAYGVLRPLLLKRR